MSQAINVQLETPPLRLQAIELPQQGDIEVEPNQPWPLLPDDIYLGQITKKELTSMKMFKGALRYFLTFEITGPAEHSGKHVYGAWPVAAQSQSDRQTKGRPVHHVVQSTWVSASPRPH